MRSYVPELVRRPWASVETWLRSRTDELRRCRECGHPVGPLDEICRHCGVAGPTRINISATLVIVALASAAFLMML